MSDPSELARLLCEFLVKTILKQEGLNYRDLSALLKEDAQLPDSGFLFKKMAFVTIDYFNAAYKALILRNGDGDAEALACFDHIHGTSNHSYICLLNVAVAMSMRMRSMIDYAMANYDSEEDYLLSIASQLTPLIKAVHDNLFVNFMHNCCGTDIRTCNPDEPMFAIKQKSE